MTIKHGDRGHVAEHNRLAALLIDAAAYGVVGDGVVDDTAALQAAIDDAAAKGRALTLAGGTYVITAPLRLGNYAAIRGEGAGRTVITHGAHTAIESATPGVRTYSWVLSGMQILGPGSGTAGAVGIDLDSVSTASLTDVLVTGEATGVRIRSAIDGGAVYNTFINCRAGTSTTGWSIEATGSNASRFIACRASGCTVGVDITDSNNTSWVGGQIEVNTTGVRITSSTNGLADSTIIDGARFENNTTAWNVTSANVRYTMISNAVPVGTYTTADAGTQTQTWGGSAATLQHKMTSVMQSTAGSWRFVRTANGGTETPALVVSDTNTASGTPVTLQAETERAVGYFFRAKRGADTYFDVHTTSGDLRLPMSGYIELRERAVDAPAPSTNFARIYLKDNGAGKTQLLVRFATGAIQVLSTEP